MRLNAEAQHTECKVDYLSDDSPTIILEGIGARTDIEADRYDIKFVSHDLSLADKFKNLLEKFEELFGKVNNKFHQPDVFKTLVAIYSPQHECPKRISVGYWTKCFDFVYSYYSAFTYNASTCPGSSGAPLFIMARDVSWWTHTFIPSGANREGNHCGATWEA
ncbi:hypothetical protein Btru_045941 [Bulinus truncatus]|nr:hypothetical protein Btru_045941 [Bulinus truncatus]